MTFPAPPPVAVVGACPLSADRCGITSFGLTGHPDDGTSFDAAPGAPLAAGGAGRYVFAPGVETFTASWTLSGPAQIVRLKLELYRRGSALADWTKELDYAAAAPGANGSTQYDGDLQVGTHAASVPPSAVTILQPGIANYPRDVLTAEHAPYKLVLRIVQTLPNTEVTCVARWIYLDVLVHDIALQLGPNAWIPAAAGHRATRRRALAVTARNDLQAQLGGVNLSAGAPAAARLNLTTNVFSKSVEDFYNNTVFAGIKGVWGDGPMLPLQATLRIRQSDGNPAGRQAGAPALGNLGVLWDWVGGAPPAHADGGARAFIAEARRYKPGDWPHAPNNCHVDNGGKRGGAAAMFESLPAVGSLPAAAQPLTAVGNRPWSTITRPITDAADADAGRAGVVFVPSRIAADTFQLRAILTYPTDGTFDVGDNGALAAVAANSVEEASPTTMTVWRRVEVAHQWRKNGGVDAASLDWADVVAFFEAACVELVPPAAGPENLTPLHYQNAFAQVRPALPVGVQQALDAAANQPNGDFGLHFVDYATFRGNVLGHMTAIRLHFAPRLPYASDGHFRAAQIQHLGVARPNGYHLEDLVVPAEADLAQTAAELTTQVLGAMGITSDQTYRAKVKSWGDDILQKVVGAHARAQSTDEPGIHLYQFEFVDNWFHQNDVAEASTTVTNYDPCPDGACGQATPGDPPPMHWSHTADHRICQSCDLRHDQSAVVTSFVPFRYMNGQNDAWSEANLGAMQRLKITAGGQFGTSAAISIAHEIGHQLGMPHAGPNAHLGPITVMRTGGIYPVFHDAADNACIMSYNFTEAARLHFCGVCSLRLAGWSMGPSPLMQRPHDAAADQNTVPLANRREHVRAQSPPMGAAWQPDPANCFGCGAAFGAFRRRHHCRKCGQVFCSACSDHEQPVRNPLQQDPVSTERVCDNCFPLGVGVMDPDPTAIWDPNENTTSCSHGGCDTRFSTTEHRHHCRVCGHIFCATHSGNERQVRYPLRSGGQVSVVRVCDGCNGLY